MSRNAVKAGCASTLISPFCRLECLFLDTPSPQGLDLGLRRATRRAIDDLLDDHTDSEVASILNARGMHSGMGLPFDANWVAVTRRHYRIRSCRTRLREKGLLTIAEICKKFKVNRWTVYEWLKSGKLNASRIDDVGRYLYELSTNITVSTQEV